MSLATLPYSQNRNYGGQRVVVPTTALHCAELSTLHWAPSPSFSQPFRPQSVPRSAPSRIADVVLFCLRIALTTCCFWRSALTLLHSVLSLARRFVDAARRQSKGSGRVLVRRSVHCELVAVVLGFEVCAGDDECGCERRSWGRRCEAWQWEYVSCGERDLCRAPCQDGRPCRGGGGSSCYLFTGGAWRMLDLWLDYFNCWIKSVFNILFHFFFGDWMVLEFDYARDFVGDPRLCEFAECRAGCANVNQCWV